MTRRKLRLLPQALRHVREIEARQQTAPKSTRRLLRALARSLLNAEAHPGIGPELAPGYKRLTVMTHTVVYRVTSSEVEVLGVLQSKAARQIASLIKEQPSDT